MSTPAAVSNPLIEGMRLRKTPDPCALVIFGASGDLTARKLIPSLYYLHSERMLPPGFAVIGCAKTPYTSERFREAMADAVKKFSDRPTDPDLIRSFVEPMHYLTDNFGEAKAYSQLTDLLSRLDREKQTRGNRLFYLATPPSSFPVIVNHLLNSGLSEPTETEGVWTRIIIEKPFGRDLASARELHRTVSSAFSEDQVYRIDHYLGKETVQNLLVFRFANGIFEPIWNRRYIDHVEITVAEDIGVEGRGAYYEESGLLRDMIQNHVMSVLSLVAMEPPATFEATQVRDEKAKVLRAIRPLDLENLETSAVRGQYVDGWIKGSKVAGYRSEPKVSASSTTETYAGLKIAVDNWRWADVPFYVRSGKRLAKRISEIVIQFRRVPHIVFRKAEAGAIRPSVMSMRIQPNEGISVKFNAKYPGTGVQIRPVKMDFRYSESFGVDAPSAYETLLLDCMLGDQTLFNRVDAVEMAWELLTPLLERWKEDRDKGLAFYESGSWGPPEADELLERDGRTWYNL